jgi:hypothetical protein
VSAARRYPDEGGGGGGGGEIPPKSAAWLKSERRTEGEAAAAAAAAAAGDSHLVSPGDETPVTWSHAAWKELWRAWDMTLKKDGRLRGDGSEGGARKLPSRIKKSRHTERAQRRERDRERRQEVDATAEKVHIQWQTRRRCIRRERQYKERERETHRRSSYPRPPLRLRPRPPLRLRRRPPLRLRLRRLKAPWRANKDGRRAHSAVHAQCCMDLLYGLYSYCMDSQCILYGLMALCTQLY